MNSSKKEPAAKRGLGSWYGLATWPLLCAPFLLAAASPAEAQPLAPPTLTVTFTPSQGLSGGSGATTLTVTATNPNTTPGVGILDHVTFSNTYPAGLVADAVSSYTCGTEAG